MSKPIVETNGVRGPAGADGPAGPSGIGGLPAGGTDGQVTTKSGSGAIWADVDGLPPGGTAGQALLKNSSTDGDASWGASAAVAPSTHAATSKATPVDADEIPLADSAATFGLKKLTWANLKATVKTYLDGTGIAKLATARNVDGQPFDGTANVTIIAPGTHAATGKTTPVGADEIPIVDSAASNVLKKLTFTNLAAWNLVQLQPDFDEKQDFATLQDTILDLFNSVTIEVDYDDLANAWPTLDATLAADIRVSWQFRFGDESTPPPTSIAGKGSWRRKVA